LLLRRLLDLVGHGELLPLFGIAIALVPGYALFDALGVKGDLGALVMGMLLAAHPASSDLAKSLFAVKDLLLVGFFVSIGLTGLPTVGETALALGLLVLLPVKALGFAALLWLCRLRRRTAVVTGTSLANFSEFGLIVVVAAPAGVLGEEWVTIIATAVAASFVLASLPGRGPEYLPRLLRRILPDRPVEQVTAEDRPIVVGDAQALVLGLGRVGHAAYDRLRDEHGLRVLGIETARDRCAALTEMGLDVVEADATDPEIWAGLDLDGVSVVLLAMPFHGNNLEALRRLRDRGFPGAVAVVARYDDDLSEALQHGAEAGLQIYDGAGSELADRAAAALGRRGED
ncbi:MAG: cation:proton antiporter, partial [Nocardioides sp.]